MDPGRGRETRKESFGERRARKEGSGEPEKREGRGGVDGANNIFVQNLQPSNGE